MPEDGNSLIQDKDTMQRIVECDGYREVRSILDNYYESYFRDVIFIIRSHVRNWKNMMEKHYLKSMFNKNQRDILRSSGFSIEFCTAVAVAVTGVTPKG